jgi:uncharacterized peroxidase-related enzyme
MPRISPVNPAAATGPVKAQLDGTAKALGGTPNMFLTAARSPATLTAMNGFFAALGRGELGAAIGERVAIAVAQQNGCEYCLAAHTAIGGAHGVPAGELADARRGRSGDARAEAAMTLARAIVERRGKVSDATLADARRAGLSDGEVVEVVAHVALNVFTNYLNNLAQTDVDFPKVELLEMQAA